MPSSFTWLDHSDRDRRRVLEAIDKFKETDTRDELGLGSLRDGFADLFFPGTSTIQTRAKYFLFVPWMYRHLEEKAVAGNIAVRVLKEEVKLRDALMASEDQLGVVGKLSGAGTKRFPSSIYWLGLSMWRIRLFPGSRDDYHRSFEQRLRRGRDVVRDDDGDRVDGRDRRAWHAHLPAPPEDFPDVASFDLTPEEARYLTERITVAAPDSLLAFLVRRARTLEADYAWTHPQFAEFPAATRDALEHARVLAETSQGAALLYNLMLSEELPVGERRDERIEYFRDRLREWCVEMGGRASALSRWNRAAFWELASDHANVKVPTRQFVETWFDMHPWRSLEAVADNPTARDLIRTRELRLKGKGRARLGNPRALELWGGEAGTARLSYRWEAALRLVRDLHAPHGTRGTRA